MRWQGNGLQRRILIRFGRVAAIAAAVLALSGLLAARRLVGSWDGVVATRYGFWFTLKLVIIAAALGLAAWRPVLAKARALGLAERRTLAAEVVLGACIVLAAAAMTASVPAAIELGQVAPVYGETILTGDASITFRASPGKVGTNEFSIVVAPAEPSFTLPPERVSLDFAPSSERLELRTSSLADPWTFRAAGDQIDRTGLWDVTAR